MVLTQDLDFTRLFDNEYVINGDDDENMVLLDGAPPDIVEIFNEYKRLLAEEKRTGKAIF